MSPAPLLPSTILVRSAPLESLPAELRLRSLEWSLLLATSGRHTVAQIGAHFGLAAEVRDATFAALLARGLVEERPLTLDEHRAALATVAPDEPRTLTDFLAQDAGAPAVDFEPLPLPVPPAPRLRLQALLGWLTEGAASAEDGQLNVYRTFLRLDPARLRAHGITTLRFEDDRTIADVDLAHEIVLSAEQTLGRPCPSNVFA
jgi:hypothetical protein